MKTVFANNLAYFRKEKGYTQHQIAIKLGVVDSCYANWEQGRTEPDISNIVQLCEIFDIEADILIGRKDIDGKNKVANVNINNSFNNSNNIKIN